MLDLRNRDLDADRLRHALATAPPDVQALRLDDNPLEDAGVDVLCGGLARFRLRRLSLQRVSAADDAFVALAACAGCNELTELDVSENDLGVRGLAALCGAPWFQELHTLDLSLNFFGDDGMTVLLAGDRPVAWRSLRLGNVGLSDAGLARLAASPLLDNVTTLDLGNFSEYPHQNVLTDAGLAALAAAGRCHQLTELSLMETAVSAAGIRLLLQSASLPQLACVRLSSCWNIDADSRRQLQATFGPRARF